MKHQKDTTMPRTVMNGDDLEQAIVDWLRRNGRVQENDTPRIQLIVPHHVTLDPLPYEPGEIEVEIVS